MFKKKRRDKSGESEEQTNNTVAQAQSQFAIGINKAPSSPGHMVPHTSDDIFSEQQVLNADNSLKDQGFFSMGLENRIASAKDIQRYKKSQDNLKARFNQMKSADQFSGLSPKREDIVNILGNQGLMSPKDFE